MGKHMNPVNRPGLLRCNFVEEVDDFDSDVKEAAEGNAGEALSACMDLDLETASDADVEAKVAECRSTSKDAYEMSGAKIASSSRRRLIDATGRVLAVLEITDVDTDTAIDNAGQTAVANAM